MTRTFNQIGAGQWFRYLVGALELAGAIGLLIPRWPVWPRSVLPASWSARSSPRCSFLTPSSCAHARSPGRCARPDCVGPLAADQDPGRQAQALTRTGGRHAASSATTTLCLLDRRPPRRRWRHLRATPPAGDTYRTRGPDGPNERRRSLPMAAQTCRHRRTTATLLTSIHQRVTTKDIP